MAKDERFCLRLSPSEREMLQAIAKANGIADSAWIRLMIHQTHRELFGVKTPERPSKAKR